MVVHLLTNASVLAGAPTFQKNVDTIHSLGPVLPLVEWTFIFLPIIFHTLYGLWITATGQVNIDKYRYTKNIFYTLQRVSAIIIIFFMVFHVFGMKGLFGTNFGRALVFEPLDATASTARHVNAAFWVWGFIYPVGVLASCYHLANGFWSAAITWGLTVSKKSQQRFGIVCTFIFLFTLACGMTALVALVRMGPPPIVIHGGLDTDVVRSLK